MKSILKVLISVGLGVSWIIIALWYMLSSSVIGIDGVTILSVLGWTFIIVNLIFIYSVTGEEKVEEIRKW